MLKVLIAALAVVLLVLMPSVGAADSSLRVDLATMEPATRRVLLQAMVGAKVSLELKDGSKLVGTIKSVEGEAVSFQPEGEGVDIRNVAVADILAAARIVSEVAKAPEDVAEAEAPDESRWRVTLKSGKAYTGRIVAMGAKAVQLALDDGVTLTLSRAKIQRMEQYDGDAPPAPVTSALTPTPRSPDPNRTRYFFAPSAMMMDAGEGYFSQKQLGFSEVGIGVTDYMSLMVGGVVPLWFVEPPESFNLQLAVKFGFEVAENLNLAFGAYGLLLPFIGGDSIGGGGFIYATLTGGSEKKHGSISVGLPMVFGDDFMTFDPVIVLAGLYRAGDLIALVTENWIFPTLLKEDFEFGMFNTFGVRFIAGPFACDVGLMHVLGLSDEVPLLPWLDFTYNWGKGP